MIQFNTVKEYTTSELYDSLKIEFITTNSEVVTAIYLDKISNSKNISSTTSSDHTIVITNTTVLTGTPGTINITPSVIASTPYTGKFIFDEMVVVTIVTNLQTSYQYAYYNDDNIYRFKISMLTIKGDCKLNIESKNNVVIFLMKESILKNAQRLCEITDCIKYYSEMQSMAGNKKYFPKYIEFIDGKYTDEYNTL